MKSSSREHRPLTAVESFHLFGEAIIRVTKNKKGLRGHTNPYYNYLPTVVVCNKEIIGQRVKTKTFMGLNQINVKVTQGVRHCQV